MWCNVYRGFGVGFVRRFVSSEHEVGGEAEDAAGIELINEGTVSEGGGRGVRLKAP